MPQKNKTNNNKKILQNYRTRTQTQTTKPYARLVYIRPEQDPPYRARITAGRDHYPIILDTGATEHFIPLDE